MLSRVSHLGVFATAMVAGTLCLATSSVSFAADTAAPASPPATQPGARARLDPQTLLGRIRPHLDELNLTPDQKTKVDALFAKAGEDLKAAMAEGVTDVSERRQKVMQILGDLKEQVAAVLDADQKEKLQTILAAIRPAQSGAAAGGAAAGGAAPAGGGAKLAQLGEALGQLDLSPEQKTKVLAVMEDLKTKVADLRIQAQAGAGAADIREKYKVIADEAKQKLTDLLTPDQQAKLHELMTAPPAKSTTEAQPAK